jgi:hypothetical protein
MNGARLGGFNDNDVARRAQYNTSGMMDNNTCGVIMDNMTGMMGDHCDNIQGNTTTATTGEMRNVEAVPPFPFLLVRA